MKRLIAALIATVALVVPAIGQPTAEVANGVVRLTNFNGETYCTGTVINAEEKFVLTADHCVNYGEILINGQPALEVFHVPELDIAVLKAPGVVGGALQPAAETAYREPVTAYGYALGAELKRVETKIIFPAYRLPEYDAVLVLFADRVIPGMSGGPVVDGDGRVVAIVQLTDEEFDLATSTRVQEWYPLIKDYWPVK